MQHRLFRISRRTKWLSRRGLRNAIQWESFGSHSPSDFDGNGEPSSQLRVLGTQSRKDPDSQSTPESKAIRVPWLPDRLSPGAGGSKPPLLAHGARWDELFRGSTGARHLQLFAFLSLVLTLLALVAGLYLFVNTGGDFHELQSSVAFAEVQARLCNAYAFSTSATIVLLVCTPGGAAVVLLSEGRAR
jgi:hypothetical protein